MNQRLKKQLILLKCRFLNRDFIKQITMSEENLTMRRDNLIELQWEKLKQLLYYAYYNCPFYYEKFNNAGLRPEKILSFDDFQHVPVLTKNEIKDNLERMVSNNVDKNLLEEVYTSGTTGFPLRIYRDRSKKNLMNALYLRTIRFWGCDLGSKTVWMWGIPEELEPLYDYRYQSKARRFLKNETWFNAFDITGKNMLQFSQFLDEFSPHLVISHVSMLCEYAHFLKKNRIKICAPKAVWITAEPSDSSQRQVIEEVFRAKTYNQYGLSEVLHIAAECSERLGLHIHADSRYVEIVDSKGESVPTGELGSIVVTDLENRVMPLIRYQNGDLSSLQKKGCTCGLNLPLMSNIVGRILDIIKLKDGRKIFGHIFARILFNYTDQIKQFQVHQTSLDQIIIRIVPEKLEDLDKLKIKILSEFRKYTRNLVSYSFEIVGQIEREKSGKIRYVKSDVQ